VRNPIRRRIERRVLRAMLDRNSRLFVRSYTTDPDGEVRVREGLLMARHDIETELEKL
jgi:hypothetical protein